MKDAFVKFWLLQARRIDALTLRERAIMFGSLALALVAAADTLVLSPQGAEQRAMTRQMQATATELQGLRAQLTGSHPEDTPAGRIGQELARDRAELGRVETEIARRLVGSGEGTQLPSLLEKVLRRHDRLTLLRLETVAPTTGATPPGSLPLQGVDLGVRGSYLDLTRYVADVEAALPGLRWGEVRIQAGSGTAPTLSARVYLLGITP